MGRSHLCASLAWLLGGMLGAGVLARDAPAAQGPAAAPQVARGAAARPGSRVAVGVGGAIAPGSTFRWKQVEGPSVAIEDPTAPQIRFLVPEGADRLEFQVTIRDEHGEQDCRVTVPIAREAARAAVTPEAEATGDPTAPRADGGVDLRGIVGQPVHLDGSRSSPAGQLGFRWLLLSGPAVSGWKADGARASFTPTQPGRYRFALLVAVGGSISEPDIVEVEVAGTAGPAPGVEPGTPLSRSIEAAVAPIPGGPGTAGQVADVFAAIAERAPLYTTYAQLQSELARRLDVVVPSEPAVRAAWTNSIFQPMSQIASTELARIGVDVRPEFADRALEPSQRERLQELYRGLADACRPRTARP